MAHDPAKDFAKRVLQARLDAGAKRGRMLTQTEIAENLSVSQVTVGRWESGETEPGLSMVARLGAELGVTPGWLAFGDDANTVPTPYKGNAPRMKPRPKPPESAPVQKRGKAS